MAYDGLNVILAIGGLAISITIPFVIRAFSKKDQSIETVHAETEKYHDEISRRLDKYEERLRMAEMEIVRKRKQTRSTG